MFRWQKREKDRKTLLNYEKRLRKERKVYRQTFSAISESGRKNRALCIGECCLQAMEKLQELIDSKKGVTFVPGSLYWTLNEKRVKDEDGEKGFEYSVMYTVMSSEPAFTEDEIRKALEDAAEKLGAETEELFRKEPEPAEE